MNTRVRRLILPIGGIAAAGLVGATLAVPAQAARDTASDTLAASGVAAKNIVAFWLSEKAANLVNATPYDHETLVSAKHISKGGPSADSKPGTVAPTGGGTKASGASKNVNLPRTTGKVFFVGADHRPHWCTATSLQSKYHNVVATAGHCVYDTESNKATMRYWVFVPGYYQGKAPWGIYVGKTAYTHYDFDVYEDGDRDYAFVTVYNGVKAGRGGDLRNVAEWNWKQVDKKEYDKYDGFIRKAKGGKYYVVKFTDAGRLGDNVGGQGFAYNQKVGKYVYVFGYPSGSHPDGNHAFSGNTLKWSYGKTFAAKAPAVKAEELVGVKSSFTGEGSSGSAWLLTYSSSRRLGYLNGVTSGVSDTDGNDRIDTSVSPYFDGETYGVYKAAANVWSGSIA
ncbi:trypsin-like serine peptidase [Microbispora sp. NBC_01389]|uniref:trypsin-like serine peptidase n=1 Tax=Microbispora sp. NBC_01389 TaxID=2903584 RepID=UPI00324BAD48